MFSAVFGNNKKMQISEKNSRRRVNFGNYIVILLETKSREGKNRKNIRFSFPFSQRE